MVPVLRFHLPLFRRALSILAGAGIRYTTWVAVAGVVLTLLNPELGKTATALLGGAWVEYSRWWSLVPIGLLCILFVGGLMKANFETFERIKGDLEQENKQLSVDKCTLEERVRALESAPRTEAEQLKHDSRQLAAELREFIKECEEEKQEFVLQMQYANTKEEERLAQQGLVHAESQYGRGHAGYTLVFRHRAATLLNAAVSRGWMDPGDLVVVDGVGPVVNTVTMESCAATLEQIGNRP